MDPTYTFHTFNDPADQPPPSGFSGFTNLMGINNFGLIAGFYGSGAMGDPSANQMRPCLDCLAGTFSPSRRQILSTRLSLTIQPAVERNISAIFR